ncbi:M67 family metallopeptidase [Lentibacillus saliphilus]|uniref:M67 family metallopeptidase n=1 Tax=Lentibacillus saliphilus TaxID=2737028 RepID=UPI001C2F3255|nr:M67 family metallopeptidase [Lentibacillus saliphilus]
MSTHLIIPHPIFTSMIEHGETQLPYESCGLLAGSGNKVLSIWTLENELKSSSRFFVHKNVVADTLQQIHKCKEHVLAIYHSHPSTAPIPSSYDVYHHTDESVKMVIVSLKSQEPQVKCFDIKQDTYTECTISIDPIY